MTAVKATNAVSVLMDGGTIGEVVVSLSVITKSAERGKLSSYTDLAEVNCGGLLRKRSAAAISTALRIISNG
jgi:hypothetical protein